MKKGDVVIMGGTYCTIVGASYRQGKPERIQVLDADGKISKLIIMPKLMERPY